MSNYDRDTIVELIDEMNTKTYFTHLATVQYKDEEYVVLQPVEQMEDVDEDEVMILHIARGADGIDRYEGIMDERVLQEVFDHFLIEAQEMGFEDEYDFPDDGARRGDRR